ncbi:sodium-dependent glucose transporter 1A-like [Physella acuta]|uniref:sodium-dependent glucose transporter 1A-like n=1 Tax=Physella acuta TaxID=109671 RepID=UPI0027DD0011|nr:sodium-dependent glucose transporter 1A-like [Physella acuta]
MKLGILLQNGTEQVAKDSEKKKRKSDYKSKAIYSSWLALSLFSLGLVVGQIGPTFLDLQIITGTDVEKASAFFTGGSVGYLTGSVISGAIYNKVNRKLMLFLGLLLLGVCSLTTPFCSIYALMIVVRTCSGVCSGFVDTTTNAEHMRVWGLDGQVLMQLLHFAFAFGGVISPLYSEPFLTEKDEEDTRNCTHESWNVKENNNSLSSQPQSTNVLYAFIITGTCVILSSLPFLYFSVKDSIRRKKKKAVIEEKPVQRKLPLPVLLFTLLVLCLFYALYCCVEDTFASFLMTFLVKEYCYVTKSKGAHVTSIYWASFAVSRFLSIFISKFIIAVNLLFICCMLMLISFACFYISATFAVSDPNAINAVIFFTIVVGLSMSAVFPSGFSWTEAELLKVTGCVSSCILVSASIGTMVNPIMLGYLMTHLSNLWFCYLLLGETVALCCVFIFLRLFNKLYINKTYGCIQSPQLSIQVSAEHGSSLKMSNPDL